MIPVGSVEIPRHGLHDVALEPLDDLDEFPDVGSGQLFLDGGASRGFAEIDGPLDDFDELLLLKRRELASERRNFRRLGNDGDSPLISGAFAPSGSRLLGATRF